MPANYSNPIKKKQRVIILKGFDLLKREKNYKQVTVVNKLKQLQLGIAKASMSNILNDKKVGRDVFWKASKGIEQLVLQELGYEFTGKEYVKTEDSGWTPIIVPEHKEEETSSNPGFTFHSSGRLRTEEKVAFFSYAQHEIVEFGVSLNSFSSYFFTRNEQEFKAPVQELLKKGVNIKCYLLDPECKAAWHYFDDRKIFLEEEAMALEKIKTALRRFKKINREFIKAGYSGHFEVFTYKHIPYNYFLVVDGDKITAKMMVSHYIYGELRANCPVIEFTKTDNRFLYRRYWNSLEKLTRGAKKIDLN